MEHQENEQPTRPTTPAGDAIYRVPEGNIEALNLRVEKLNRRAKRLKLDALVLATVGEAFEERTKRSETIDWSSGRPGVTTYLVRFVLVTLTGKSPRVNGWAMAATIQHEEGGNLLRTVPGFETMLPLVYRNVDPLCDHCHTGRTRKDTYVLQSEAGEWKQVGRSCLADFLRSENAGALAEYAEMLAGLDEELSDFEDEEFGGGHQKQYWKTLTVLAQVACCVRADGWCSRGEARASFVPKTATVDQALSCFDDKLWAKLSAADQEKLTPTDADREKAGAAITWAQDLPVDVTSYYMWNIRVVSQRENVSHREAGLAGSIISAYNRFLEQEMDRKYELDHPSEWFGEIKKREIFTLTVMGLRDIQSDFGSSTLVSFRDPAGNRAKWFCSGEAIGFEVGTNYVVKATVKQHELYRSSKQTLLSRVAIYDAAAEAQAKADAKAAKKAAKQAAKEQGAEPQEGPAPEMAVAC